jgi:hypothetical protein
MAGKSRFKRDLPNPNYFLRPPRTVRIFILVFAVPFSSYHPLLADKKDRAQLGGKIKINNDQQAAKPV